MFQYAAARSLALRHRTSLSLDLAAYDRPGRFAVGRPYELDRLNISICPAKHRADLAFLLARRSSPLLHSLSGWQPFRERSLAYDSAVVELPNGTYLFGYWQSWRYFSDTSAEICADFQPKVPMAARNRSMEERMMNGNSVFIHVRRGDYVESAEANAFHGVIGFDYYRKATRIIQERFAGLKAFVFSDDLKWCREAFAPLGLDLTIIDWNRAHDSWQDMFLMAACNHGVIANSSFSWWGAWLGDQGANPGNRVVVAPRLWFAGSEASMQDRCPPIWTTI